MKPIGSIIFSLYRGSSDHEPWIAACLQGAWPAIVGEKIAQVCRPSAVDKTTLLVDVLDPAWEETLVSMKPELLERIQEATGNEVRHIRIRTVSN